MTAKSVQGQWAYRTFGRIEAGDRRVRRVVEIAAKVAARPAGTVTEVFDDGAEREAAYRLLSSDAVPSKAVAEAMFEATAKQCATHQQVYVAIDGSSLSVTDRKHARDVGWVGKWELGARGVHVISALALDAYGVPIGVCAQTWWARKTPSPKWRNDFRTLDEKETRFLGETVEGAKARLDSGAAKTRAST